jgi:putative ATP-dependent endonuclease of the OLD family
MKINSLELVGFRCFEKVTVLDLSPNTTVLIGANGSGKTALLIALARLFGISHEEKTIVTADFNVPVSEALADQPKRELTIEARFSFPELASPAVARPAIPPTFKNMIVTKPHEDPYCLLRLEATWQDDGTPDGQIEQSMHWIDAGGDKQNLQAFDRSLIQVHYIPAARHISELTAYATSVMAKRLIRAIDWSPQTRRDIESSVAVMRTSYEGEPAIKKITKLLETRWQELHDSKLDTTPRLSLLENRFAEIVRRFQFALEPSEQQGQHSLDELSDGQQSLFYFSLATTVFDVESEIMENTSRSSTVLGFRRDKLTIPALTVFAMEEPENHLSPFYLSRVIAQLESIAASNRGQVVLTSHSPAILGRVEPSAVRHFRLSPQRRTRATKVELPAEPEEASKYVREAVRAYPELYFARYVILAEGDSEQVVIPRIARARNLLLDPAFVAVVPLGGRHVTHFWKLLTAIRIPYATLLDLDLGREGAGWGRIKYACEKLIAFRPELRPKIAGRLPVSERSYILKDDELATLHKRTGQVSLAWLKALEAVGVYFSEPLDLDFAMLRAFPAFYEKSIPPNHGPRVPTGSRKKQAYLQSAEEAVLGAASSGLYAPSLKGLFPLYRYLFLNKSKPSSHLLAISQIPDSDLSANSPEVLLRLLTRVSRRLG